MEYDIIGDIHGQAPKLVALLKKMGYQEQKGAWRHPDRAALFVGDLIDRGPGQIETLDIVRRMVNEGTAQAVMGNHEFNAIAWYLPDPDAAGMHLRQRDKKNYHQHAAFLREVGCDSALHKEWIEWFLTLPLWLELPQLRVVHACWHPGYMAELAPYLVNGNRLNTDLVEMASREGSMRFRTIEGLTKGLEVELPKGHFFIDKDGHRRTSVRARWWDDDARTFRQTALIDKVDREKLPDTPIPSWARIGYANDKPVFFGHYWHTGPAQILTPHIACVDYSAGNGGPLVAYRWQGEAVLDAENFVTTD